MLIGLFPAWLAVCLFGTEWTHLHDHIASRHWPSVRCEIFGSAAPKTPSQDYDTTFHFRYKMAGVSHEASQTITCATHAESLAAVAAHPPVVTTCLVDPDRPGVAMIARISPRGMAINLAVAGVAALIALVLFTGGAARLLSRDGGIGRWPERTGQIAFGSVFASVGLMVAALAFQDGDYGVVRLVPLLFGGIFFTLGTFVMFSKTDGERHTATRQALQKGDVELTPTLTPQGGAVLTFAGFALFCGVGMTVLYAWWRQGMGISPGIMIGATVCLFITGAFLRSLPKTIRAARRPRIRIAVLKKPSGELEIRWQSSGDMSGYAAPRFQWVRQVRVRHGRGSRLEDADVRLLWSATGTLDNTGSFPLLVRIPQEFDDGIRLIRVLAKDPVDDTDFVTDYSF